LVLDLFFRLGGAVPVGENKTTLFDLVLEFVPAIDDERVLLTETQRLLVDVGLYLTEQAVNVIDDALERASFLGQRIAAGDLDAVVLKIAHTESETHRDAAKLVLGKLPTRPLVIVIVVFDRNTSLSQLF